MKPHEETWAVHPTMRMLVKDAPFPGDHGIALDVGHAMRFDKDDGERLRLAAQAPAMARVLLKVEWAGRQDYVGDGGYNCCSCCGGIAPENEALMDAVDDLKRGKTVVGHYPNCELAAALRAAGVLP